MDLGTIGKKFKKISKDTIAEVQKMNDIRQINSRISEQKKQIEAIYSQMGQKLYKLYKEAPLEGFDTEFQKIEERVATIEVYNDQIREIKGVRLCPNCHTEVLLSERYCSACGQKLPEILHIQKDEDGNTIIEGPDAEIIDVPPQEKPEPARLKEKKTEDESGKEQTTESVETEPEESAEAEAAVEEAEPEEPEEAEAAVEEAEPEEPVEAEAVAEEPEPEKSAEAEAVVEDMGMGEG